MAILTRYYDYELKKEAYKLAGVKGYVRNTTTLLKLVNIVDTTMDYCTATFKLDVVGDTSESQIVIYDGDSLIKFTYDNTEYTYLDWSNQITSQITITVKLNYETSHNIQARYLGNLHCLQSKSKIVQIFQDKPATARTVLTVAMSNSNGVYNYSQNPSASATLSIVDTSLNPTANRNQTISFYDNGELIGTATTNNSGVATYTFSNMSRGHHIVTATFDGNEYLFGSENNIECSKGYNVEIIEYPRYVLNDDNITVTAQLTNFFGEPFPSKTVYIANTSNTSVGVSATTNSDGKATLTMDSAKYLPLATTVNSMKSVPYTVKYTTGDYSESVTTIDSQNMIIELDDSINYISATNQLVEIVGSVTPSRTGLFPIGVDITANGVTETIQTSENGTFKYKYIGQGVGDTTVSASIYDVTDSIDVEDLLQYWRANNTSLNKAYKWIVGEFRELTSGFKLSVVNPEVSACVGLGEGITNFNQDFELSFEIVGSANVTQMGVKQWRVHSTNPSFGHVNTNATVQNGDIIKAICQDGTITTYLNDVVISSRSAGTFYPAIWIKGNVKGAYVLFDNLKFKVI